MQQFIDSYDFKGKKAIVRVDFNVPLNENFEITDDTRIRAALPTLKKVLAGGGALIIMSHLGRPKKVDPKFSLKHILAHVSELLGVPVQFAEDCQKAQAQAAALKPGEFSFSRTFVTMQRKRENLVDLQRMLPMRKRRQLKML